MNFLGKVMKILFKTLYNHWLKTYEIQSTQNKICDNEEVNLKSRKLNSATH